MSPPPADAWRAASWALLVVPSLTACAPPSPATTPSPASIPCVEAPCRERADALLDALRRRYHPPGAHNYRLAVSLDEGRTGRSFAARGACAVRPPDALRMQLVGPAGALALDLWVSGDRARLSLPVLDRVEHAPEAFGPGRPTVFLRWWLLGPLEGEVVGVWASPDGATTRWRLRSAAGDEVEVTSAGETLRLERQARGDHEQIEARGGACGEAVYRSEQARLRVEVRCEGEGPTPGDRPFEDPDSPR
jgi:hypothetical protein